MASVIGQGLREPVSEIEALRVRVNRLLFHALNRVLGNPGLAIGTSSKKKVKVVTATPYVLNGALGTVSSSTEVAFTATTMDIPANAGAVQEAVYLLTVNTGGTPTLTMGAIASGAGNAVIPDVPTGHVLLGYVRIAVDAGSTPFDATSDDLDAAHLTVTYTNAAIVPDNDTLDTVDLLE